MHLGLRGFKFARRLGVRLGRQEVVEALIIQAQDGEQHLDATRFKLGHRLTTGVAGVAEDRLGLSERIAQRGDGRFKRRRLRDIGRHDQLAAIGTNHSLCIIQRTLILLACRNSWRLELAHQLSVWIIEIALPAGWWPIVRRFGLVAAPVTSRATTLSWNNALQIVQAISTTLKKPIDWKTCPN